MFITNLISEAGTTVDTSLSTVVSTLNTVIPAVFSWAGDALDFISSHGVTMLALGISFAGVGFGMLKRAFRTSHRA
ncbi:MAG: hypothetical protein NC299_09770 [Lachnospiraceae bacterium]|nr:hypothetical protein [Ruminococcus sp.]MCM1275641.1 hypothetical protein [Lachnospiraceae bacterium]